MFDANGFVVIPGALSADELADVQTWTQELASDLSVLHHHEMDAQGDVRPSRTERIVDSHQGFKGLLYDGTVKQILDDVCGTDMTLYKEKINYKYPNAGSYRTHQDAPAYPEVDFHVTALVSIDDASVEAGCVEFAENWTGERREFVGLTEKGVVDEGVADKLTFCPAPTKAGDVVVFTSYIPHRSLVNRTAEKRRVLYATFNATVKGDFRKEYYVEKLKKLESKRISLIDHFHGDIVQELDAPSAGASKEEVWRYISFLMAARGQTMYDETVTQLEHGLQTATLAIQAGASRELVSACFLHDIGHLILDEHNGRPGFLAADLRHEAVGAAWLEQFFPEALSNAVKYHVPAKRFLCFERPDYWRGLSDMSKRSLEVQGGIFSESEANAFLEIVGSREAIQVREFDDKAKKKDVQTISMEDLKPMVLACMRAP